MISQKIRTLTLECESELSDVFKALDEISQINTEKVLEAFREQHISDRHFNSTSGYGYDDDGRDAADKLFARVFGCEDGFVTHNIISGTHAISVGLFGLLRPGDTLLSVTGRPYDTLDGVIGFGGVEGSLMDFGVKYDEIPLINNNFLDIEKIKSRLISDKNIKIVYIQRSKGYLARRTLTAAEITKLYI
ncbi:MAG: methionine gamma-lyase family protein, partial [Clostridia bacterium]